MAAALTAKNALVHVEGAWLAEHARALVLEGKWSRALKLLTDCLSGMTFENAITILKGEADLKGWTTDEEGVQLIPLKSDGALACTMRSGLTRLYGSMFHHQNECWSPYATVGFEAQGTAERSIEAARNILTDQPLSQTELELARRALSYANDPQADLAVLLHTGAERLNVVLCEKTATPPLWFDLPAEPPVQTVKSLLAQGIPAEARGQSEEEGLLSGALRESSASIGSVDAQAQSAWTEAAQRRTKYLAALRSQVRSQADRLGGYYCFPLTEEGRPYVAKEYLDVPRHPFLLWALRDFAFEKFGKKRPEWPLISPPDLKTPFDDPYHTDWVVGAGLSLDEADGGAPGSFAAAVYSSAHRERLALCREWTGSELTPLSGGTQQQFSGIPVVAMPYRTVPPGSIALVPCAGPEYEAAMRSACTKDRYGSAGLVLCAEGNEDSYLSVLGRQMSHTVLLVPDAVEKFRGARSLCADLKEGRVWQLPR